MSQESKARIEKAKEEFRSTLKKRMNKKYAHKAMKHNCISTELGTHTYEDAMTIFKNTFEKAAKELNVDVSKIIMSNSTGGGYRTNFYVEEIESDEEFESMITYQAKQQIYREDQEVIREEKERERYAKQLEKLKADAAAIEAYLNRGK